MALLRASAQDKSAVTKAWVRNRSDELAVDNGCWFDPAAGGFVVWWIENYCRLYEGEWAGEPMVLRGCTKCENEQSRDTPWKAGGKEEAIERAAKYAKCVKRGHRCDWQYEVTMRLFGWQKKSARWKRAVRRFRRAGIWVPKKNKKSPTLAAWGLYLTCADGEQGQKVYFGAKDGTQAREIAGKHAIEMVDASPELTEACSVNRSLMQITHEETRSILKPISSSDSRRQKSKEGLNGSILIDETHVVDREFIGGISRAGISRSEPMHIEVSTAGDDPEGYGRERYDRGKLIESGIETDELQFFAFYESPQDLADEELAKDPVKYGRMCNPAWGHTVGEDEYLSDYNSSKHSLAELSRFKMYRLNIWQSSAQPWLNMGSWAECKRDYAEADLLGRVCYGGLDLAKTRDTCALVLNFPEEDGTYKQLAHFWIPQERAETLRDKVNYLQWAQQGFATLTPGGTTDYSFIRNALKQAKERFDFRQLAYDDRYAEEMLQRLVEEDYVFRLDEVCPFRQTITDFAGPTDQYEGLVIEGKLHHNGNKLFTWQAGNTTVKVDVNHNKRPVKQKHGDIRTIDGMVAAIMALAVAQKLHTVSVYETRGMVTLGEEAGEPVSVGQFPGGRYEPDEDDF